MPAGLHRSDTEYIWPASLDRPVGVNLVYLDLNHWVALAKAAVGHRDGRDHVTTLEALRQAKESGEYLFPLSSTHFMEIAPVKNARHRLNVATVMEELSGFTVLIPRDLIMVMEIEAALGEIGAAHAVSYSRVPLLGRGVLRAFGKVGGLRVRTTGGEDITERFRAEFPRGGPAAFDVRREDAERQLDRAVLCGPSSPDEERELRAAGWDPMVARQIGNERAAAERAQAERFAEHPHWRKQRVRDVVAARHMFTDLNETLSDRLAARGLELEDVCGDPESTRRLVDSMPSSDAAISLTAAAHRNPETKWTANRIFDTDALSVAVPYCDFVATDNEAAHAVNSEGLAERQTTTVVSSLRRLVQTIS